MDRQWGQGSKRRQGADGSIATLDLAKFVEGLLTSSMPLVDRIHLIMHILPHAPRVKVMHEFTTNCKYFSMRKDQLVGSQRGDDLAVGSDRRSPPCSPWMTRWAQNTINRARRPTGLMKQMKTRSTHSSTKGENWGLRRWFGGPGPDRTCPAFSQRFRAVAVDVKAALG